MGTRTDILKIAGQLRELAIKNPSVGLMPIVTELEAAAERADKKRMTKKKLVEDLLRVVPTPIPLKPFPNANFLSTVVGPRLSDPALKLQLADYEKSVAALVQQAERSGASFAGAVSLFRTRWDA
jgi:hypothetical protein